MWVGSQRGRLDRFGTALAPARTIPASDLTRIALGGISPCILVLGDESLRSLAPDDVRAATRGLRVVALAVADGQESRRRRDPVFAPSTTGEQLSIEHLVTWARSFLVEFVAADRLADRVVVLQATGLRASVDASIWLPLATASSRSRKERLRGPGRLQCGDERDLSDATQHFARTPPRNPHADDLVNALTSLPRPRVAAWAAALSMSRHGLGRATAAQFGRSPRELCRAYVRACFIAERADGRSLAEIADGLGYADASTLLAAVGSRDGEVAETEAPERFERRAVQRHATENGNPRELPTFRAKSQ